MPGTRESKRWPLALGFLGVLVAILLGRPLVDQFKEKSAPLPPEIQFPPTPEARRPPPPEELAKPHLDQAQKESEQVIVEHVKALDAFFADSKKNTRAFAEEALGFGSKWRLVIDYIPFTGGDRHKEFIRAKFEEYIFKQSQLEGAVKQVVKSYLAHIRSIESKMLVDLRTDVADFPSAYVLARIDEKKVESAYDEAISRAIEATGSGLRADLAIELVSLIAGEVLTQVAVRIGVSAGILGTGAASSPATLGIGLVVSLIIDQLVSWIWDWWADPRGNLARELDNKLDEINRLIVNGSNDVKGLRSRLEEFARERAGLRRQAILALLRPQTGGIQ